MFYVFHGDDAHSQRETLARLKGGLGDPQMLDLNTTRLNGRGLSFPQLRQACDTVPFLAPIRLVVVEELLAQKPAQSFMDELLAYLPTLPETTRLIFLESKALPARSPLLKLAEKAENGYSKAFERPQGRELEGWIRERVRALDGRITPRAVHILAASIGNNLETVDNEIEKLVLYRAGDGPVDADDVALLSPYAAEASIFDLVDALGNRNGRQAALLLQEKANEGADPFYLFAMFVRQFRLLIQIKELAESGLAPPAISKALKLHSFVVGKLFQQCQRFTLEQLEQIYAHLLEVDVGVKTGQTEMDTALDLLVVGLTN